MKSKAKTKSTTGSSKEDVSRSYNVRKEFDGKRYTGMQVGRSHKWNYDKGVWRETKVTPDRWEISYHVTKRRAGRAPEGSGTAVGTGYHWFILSHQYVNFDLILIDGFFTHETVAVKSDGSGEHKPENAAQSEQLYSPTFFLHTEVLFDVEIGLHLFHSRIFLFHILLMAKTQVRYYCND